MTRASEARVALVFATFGIVNELASAASTVVLGAAVVGARAQCLARAARVTSMKLRHAAVLSLLSPAAAALRPCAVAPLRRCASATRLGSTLRVAMVDAAPMPAIPPVPADVEIRADFGHRISSVPVSVIFDDSWLLDQDT